MKDNRLEKEFDEYFKGVSQSNDITADAKKFVKPRRKIMPKFLKFASIAASFVLVFAVALTFILKNDFKDKSSGNDMSQAPNYGDDHNAGSSPGPSGGNDYEGDPSGGTSGDTEPPSSTEPSSGYYTDDDLIQNNISADNISSLSSSLTFIEKFAKSTSASVSTCKAGYIDGKLTLVTVKLNVTINMIYNHETDIFVEFAKNSVYRGLEEYFDGEENDYNGVEYYLTQNGEESKLFFIYKGVKYYFNIRSNEQNAYLRYLQWVVN